MIQCLGQHSLKNCLDDVEFFFFRYESNFVADFGHILVSKMPPFALVLKACSSTVLENPPVGMLRVMMEMDWKSKFYVHRIHGSSDVFSLIQCDTSVRI